MNLSHCIFKSLWRSTAVLSVLYVILNCSPLFAAMTLKGTQPAHCRVTWTDDPATTATVSWSTRDAGSKHTLRFRIKGAAGDENAQADEGNVIEGTAMAESGRYTGGQAEFYYHHVRLTDLKPSTQYEVQMHSDGDHSPWFYFETGPDHDRPFSLINGGDSRTGHKDRLRVNEMIATMVSDSFANDDPSDDILAFAHGGDYIVKGSNVAQWLRWLSDHESTTGKDGRMLPIIPARGNHDRGKPFNQVFGFPDGDKNYYAVNIGPQVRFVTLNSEISAAGDQAKWIDSEMLASRAENRWLLAQYHRPIYPAVKAPSSALKVWAPLFEKHDVDLVCEADGHNVKRTVPIRNGKQDPTGVVYIGEGGLGVPQRTPKTDRWYLQSPGMADKAHHIFVLTFQEDQLIGKCVLLDGTVRDEFTRQVRSPVLVAN
ncbi:hypothetical protein LF1_13220 [Rubripirellula obstinata]|uniref:PhoD-like phosphatase n=1 Tax=Rubripirellula obstinata TaxID=406547 RepID=A0A5B1CGC2_9BACT|nr:metallophosphoesterase family protein [Rubripirellula obstinata]KAA1258799.1 hypothetical protein LF1_13220 [Rubripirellula obstinata]